MPVNKWKWQQQFIINFFTAISLYALGILLFWINFKDGDIHSSKLTISIGTIILGIPSTVVIGHLMMMKGKTAMSLNHGKLSEQTRLGRKIKDVSIEDIETIDIIYRSRPFSGISREYKVSFSSDKEDKEEAFLADYLISRPSLESFVEDLKDSAGILDEE